MKKLCKKCLAREGACKLLKIIKKMVVKEDIELIHKSCNCYATHYTVGVAQIFQFTCTFLENPYI